MVFWLVLVAASVLVSASLVLALRRGGGDHAQAENDIPVYRDQLREIDRDLERGLIDAETAARTRLEVSRRILAADDRRGAGAVSPAPRRATMAAALLTALIVVGGSLGVYAWLGAPGYGDLPLKARLAAAEQMRATRPGQAAAEAQVAQARAPGPETTPEHQALVAELRETMKSRPDDPRGWMLLARHEAALGNFAAAHAAQMRLIGLKGDSVTGQDYADYADLLILAAGGYVSPEAEVALADALKRDPGNGVARYYSGEMLMQTGRPDQAFMIWRDLLREGPEDAPWIPPIRAQIEEAAMRAGIPFEMPEVSPLPGPSAEDMAAAADMTPEERMEMVRGMVGTLAERLATEGGAPQEWARLISALGVLGETGQAQAIWTEAQQTFAGNAEALALLRQAADGAGITN